MRKYLFMLLLFFADFALAQGSGGTGGSGDVVADAADEAADYLTGTVLTALGVVGTALLTLAGAVVGFKWVKGMLFG